MVSHNPDWPDWDFFPKQTEAMDVLDRPSVTELMYGGAKGGGKSVFGVRWMYLEKIKLINQFKLKPTKYPLPLGWMGRKEAVAFNNTTFETWKAFIDPDFYRIREQAKEIIIRETVKICYGGFDRSEDTKKFNSAEYCRFFIDQAEEISQDEIGVLRGSMRRKIKDTVVPVKGLLTANPAQCWLKDEFITAPPANGSLVFVQALPSDNPKLPPSYFHQLETAWKHRPELLRAYLYGDWDAMEGADQVIKDIWIREAGLRTLHTTDVRHVITCDPARFGDDETVIYRLRNSDIIEEKIYGQKDTHFTAN